MRCDMKALADFCEKCQQTISEADALAASACAEEAALQVHELLCSMQQETERVKQSVRFYRMAQNKAEHFICSVKV